MRVVALALKSTVQDSNKMMLSSIMSRACSTSKHVKMKVVALPLKSTVQDSNKMKLSYFMSRA